jgi:hypothetical protein
VRPAEFLFTENDVARISPGDKANCYDEKLIEAAKIANFMAASILDAPSPQYRAHRYSNTPPNRPQ